MRSLLTGCTLFLGGAASALFVDHVIARHYRPRAVQGGAPSVQEIDSALALTPAQRDSVHAIFARHQHEIDSAWQQINRGVMSTMDSVHAALQGVLTPEQVRQLHALMLERHGLSVGHPGPR